MNAIDIRHYLHQHPELSLQEKHTHDFIVEQLRECHPTRLIEHVGKDWDNVFQNGIIAVWGSNPKAPTIAFRADIDALPIQEDTDLPYRSENPGVSHKCGHDGHTATLLRLAQILSEVYHDDCPKPEYNLAYANVLLLFQPAEEVGLGARLVLWSNLLQCYNIQSIYGFHNIPGYPLGEILLRKKTFACASVGVDIRLTGRGTHASTPTQGISPANALTDLLSEARRYDNPHPRNISEVQGSTVIYAHMGEPNFGTAPGSASMGVTLRSHSDAVLNHMLRDLVQVTKDVCRRTHGLDYQLEYKDPFSATTNAPTAVDRLRDVCDTAGVPFRWLDRPFRWSEDFGLYLQKFHGAFFGVGAGEGVELHHPDYDFPDAIIEPTAQFMFLLAQGFSIEED